MRVPDGLRWLEAMPDGARWLRELPTVVAETAERWDLEIEEPFETSHVSWVAPALRLGERVVVKVQWPHPECAHEAAALEVWDGDGAVQLLDHDPAMHVLLLEHCDPGMHLADVPDADPLTVLIDLLPRLWRPVAAPFQTVADEAVGWMLQLTEGRNASEPAVRRLVEAAIDYLRDLPPSQGEQVLVHQDLHGDNVLAAQRGPWLVIDPKPLVAERELSLAPIVRSFELGHSRAAVIGRLDRLSAELGLDRERARCWTLAQTVAWSDDSDFAARHLETAAWLLDA